MRVAVLIGLGRLFRKRLKSFVEVTSELAPVDSDLEKMCLIMLPERRFILKQVEPLAEMKPTAVLGTYGTAKCIR